MLTIYSFWLLRQLNWTAGILTVFLIMNTVELNCRYADTSDSLFWLLTQLTWTAGVLTLTVPFDYKDSWTELQVCWHWQSLLITKIVELNCRYADNDSPFWLLKQLNWTAGMLTILLIIVIVDLNYRYADTDSPFWLQRQLNLAVGMLTIYLFWLQRQLNWTWVCWHWQSLLITKTVELSCRYADNLPFLITKIVEL